MIGKYKKHKKTPSKIELPNGIALSLCYENDIFKGFSDVSAHNIKLRNSQRPFFVSIRNPWGIRLCDFRIEKIIKKKSAVKFTFSSNSIVESPMEWQLHDCRPLQNTGDWCGKAKPAKSTSLSMTLQAISRKIGKLDFYGFSYLYAYKSKDIPIYYILDRATWETGGGAVGNELWFRNANFPSISKIKSVSQHFSSEWFLDNCLNPNIFQFLPLQTHLQGFTMTVSKEGVLITWSPEPAHIRTLLEKQQGMDDIVHMHEHCADLSKSFRTTPMEILFLNGSFDRTALANIHGDMIDLVYYTLHRKTGIHREYASTYGQIEEWGDADIETYRHEGLPALANAGIKNIELANHFRNNMNTWGVSNMCCNVDLKLSENVGEDKLKAFCNDATKRGIRVFMWGNTAVSTLSYKFAQRQGKAKGIKFLDDEENSIIKVIAKSKSPYVRTTYGSIDADHYAPDFCVLNIRDKTILKYWMDSWKYLHDKIGISGIFLDSSFNISSDKFNWVYNPEYGRNNSATMDQTGLLGKQRPKTEPQATIESMYFAHLALIRKMQKAGFKYCGEDSGVFGLHRNGPDLLNRIDNLFMWNEFICQFDAEKLRRAGHDPDDIFFRGLAFRIIWDLLWVPKTRELSFRYDGIKFNSDLPQDYHIKLYHAFNKVAPYMRNRNILENDLGVTYSYKNKTVLWAFSDFSFDLEKISSITDVIKEKTIKTKKLRAEKHRLYVLSKAG